MQDDRVSPREAGELIGAATGGAPISKESVCRWVRLGKLSGVRVGGRTFINMAALGEFLRAGNPTAALRPLAERLRAAGKVRLAGIVEGKNEQAA